MRTSATFLSSSLGVLALFVLVSVAAVPVGAVTHMGCFNFSSGNTVLPPMHCNARANDITVFFRPGGNCFVAFGPTGAGQSCPSGANNIDVTWGPTPLGTAITKCVWTHGNHILPNPCPLPPTPPPTFRVLDIQGTLTTIPRVFWTLNGAKLGSTIFPPAGVVNNLEFKIV